MLFYASFATYGSLQDPPPIHRAGEGKSLLLIPVMLLRYLKAEFGKRGTRALAQASQDR